MTSRRFAVSSADVNFLSLCPIQCQERKCKKIERREREGRGRIEEKVSDRICVKLKCIKRVFFLNGVRIMAILEQGLWIAGNPSC